MTTRILTEFPKRISTNSTSTTFLTVLELLGFDALSTRAARLPAARCAREPLEQSSDFAGVATSVRGSLYRHRSAMPRSKTTTERARCFSPGLKSPDTCYTWQSPEPKQVSVDAHLCVPGRHLAGNYA